MLWEGGSIILPPPQKTQNSSFKIKSALLCMRVRARFLGRCIIEDRRHFKAALGPPPRHYRTGGRQRHCRALGGCGGSTPVRCGFPFFNSSLHFHRRSLRWMCPLYLFAQFLGANELRRFFEFFYWFFLCFQHFYFLMLRFCLSSFVHFPPFYKPHWSPTIEQCTTQQIFFWPSRFGKAGVCAFVWPIVWFLTIQCEEFLLIWFFRIKYNMHWSASKKRQLHKLRFEPQGVRVFLFFPGTAQAPSRRWLWFRSDADLRRFSLFQMQPQPGLTRKLGSKIPEGIGRPKFGCDKIVTKKTYQMTISPYFYHFFPCAHVPMDHFHTPGRKTAQKFPPFLKDLSQVCSLPNFSQRKCPVHIPPPR